MGANLLAVARERAGLLAGEERGRALGAIATGWFLILGLRYAFPTLLPQLKQAFGMGNATAGFAVTLVWACYALTQFPAGLLDDWTGERLLLTASLVLAALSLGLLSVAPAVSVFLAACAAFGLGTGLYGPPRGTAVSNLFPDSDDAAIGVVLAAGSLGAALLPAAAAAVVGRFGVKRTVALALPLFALAAVGVWRAVPQSTGESASYTPVEAVRAASDDVVDFTVLRAVGAVTVMLFTLQGLTTFLPTYLIQAKGLSQGTAATLFALLFVSGAGFQVAAGGAADRFGERPVLVAVAALGAVTVAALPFVEGVWTLGLVVCLLGVRLAVAPLTNAYIVGVLPDDDEGTAWGLLRTCFFLVAATGSLFVGLFSGGGFDAAFLALAGLTVVAVGLYATLPERSGADDGGGESGGDPDGDGAGA